MTYHLNTPALQRYHDRFDANLYNAVGEFIASNLNAERDDVRVVSGMIAMQNAALELCGDIDHAGAWHRLAVYCGRSFISMHTVSAIWRFLRPFNEDDPRLSDFEATAKAMLLAYSALDDLKTATAHANGVHSWQGRAAYNLFAAADLLTHAGLTLLVQDDETYTREKLRAALHRVTSALYEGVRHSEQPSLYDLSTIYFPGEHNRH